MVEELKELLTVIGSVPDMALNAFVMFGIYKLFVYVSTTAGIYGVVKLGINKLHDYKTMKIRQPSIVEYKIGDKFISATARLQFDMLMDELRAKRFGAISGQSSKLQYIHESDIEKLLRLLREADEKRT